MRHVFRIVAVAAALVAGVGLWRSQALPAPFAVAGAPPATGRELRVAYHVHSSRSDGTGSADEIAGAAASAGVDAVILTDHGDGTRVTEAPRRLHGVLVVDAAEISTWGGHYVALGARPSPFPLGGDPSSVVDDVAWLGGMGIAAHPGSPKDGLKWRAWDAAMDGVEWLNADSEWRDRPRDLWAAFVTYPWAPAATIVHLLNRPIYELRMWDRLAAQRPVVGLAGHDAHARLGLRGVGEPCDGAVAVRAPGYAAMFRAFSNVVRIDGPWGDDAAADSATVVAALRRGRVYAMLTGRGVGRVQRFEAASGGRSASMGAHLAPAGPVRVDAEIDAPLTATTSLVCDGTRVTSHAGGRLTWMTDRPPGACRLEVTADGGAETMPWIVTNPIYLRADPAGAAPHALPAEAAVLPVPQSGDAAAWTGETAPGAAAEATADPRQTRRVGYHWRLGDTASTFAAIALPAPTDLARYDRLILRASADRPTRVWVQLRTPNDGGRRWGRSVRLDATTQPITLPLASFLPMDGASAQVPPLADVKTLLLVVDTTHARPRTSGTVTFDEWWMAR